MKAERKKLDLLISKHFRLGALLCVCAVFIFSATGCNEIQQTAPEKYFAATQPPQVQEFRWTNGKKPKTADPSIAKAAPETDVVRAIYEGLTELDAANLSVVPAAAESWKFSKDHKTWTFQIRRTAVWSDDTPVTAEDFKRSWHRAARSGEGVNANYFSNVVGLKPEEKTVPMVDETQTSSLLNSIAIDAQTIPGLPIDGVPAVNDPPLPSPSPTPKENAPQDEGLIVESEKTLVVKLIEPDPDFARLIAHPIFRPVHKNDAGKKDAGISAVTNGAFELEKQDGDGVILKRSESYWNKASVKLDRIKMIPSESPEKALEAYRLGNVDAISNAEFSPLVLKLLTPYEDLKKTTFAALNFYEINLDKPQFKDRRIREALAIAIERERLTEGELEGTTQPALTFTPFGPPSNERLIQDKERARDLFEESGYPNGLNFPKIKLVINRNDTQQRIAKSVAAMWKDVLNIDCEIVIKDTAELEKLKTNKDYDLIRRGVVFTTPNKISNLKTLFGENTAAVAAANELQNNSSNSNVNANTNTDQDQILFPDSSEYEDGSDGDIAPMIYPRVTRQEKAIITQSEALHQVYAIPLYFPISFSLVKPYVDGFEINNLDAQFLQQVSIDQSWYQSNTK